MELGTAVVGTAVVVGMTVVVDWTVDVVVGAAVVVVGGASVVVGALVVVLVDDGDDVVGAGVATVKLSTKGVYTSCRSTVTTVDSVMHAKKQITGMM